MDSLISWIQDWRNKYCDRDWESENGIEIKTISNPGWTIEIDLDETPLEEVSYNSGLIDQSTEYLDRESSMVLVKHDWFHIEVGDGKFTGSGDNLKLLFILQEFKRLCIEHGEDLNKPRPTYE